MFPILAERHGGGIHRRALRGYSEDGHPPAKKGIDLRRYVDYPLALEINAEPTPSSPLSPHFNVEIALTARQTPPQLQFSTLSRGYGGRVKEEGDPKKYVPKPCRVPAESIPASSVQDLKSSKFIGDAIDMESAHTHEAQMSHICPRLNAYMHVCLCPSFARSIPFFAGGGWLRQHSRKELRKCMSLKFQSDQRQDRRILASILNLGRGRYYGMTKW